MSFKCVNCHNYEHVMENCGKNFQKKVWKDTKVTMLVVYRTNLNLFIPIENPKEHGQFGGEV